MDHDLNRFNEDSVSLRPFVFRSDYVSRNAAERVRSSNRNYMQIPGCGKSVVLDILASSCYPDTPMS